MDAPGDRHILHRTLSASLRFRGDGTSIAGFFLALTLLVLYLLLMLFAEGGSVGERLAHLPDDPAGLTWFVVTGILAVRILWAVGGQQITAAAALRLLPRIADAGAGSRLRRAIRADLLDTPLSVLAFPVLLFLVTIGLLQAARIPYAGKPLLFVLLPVFAALAFGIVRPILRWLGAGHLVGPGLLVERDPSFPAQTTAFGWLTADPLRVLGLRAGAALLALGAVALRVAGFALLGLLIHTFAPEALERGFGRILLVVGAWWTATLLLSACFSLRAVQYLILRRALDSVPIEGDSPASFSGDLRKLGITLVEKLAREEEE